MRKIFIIFLVLKLIIVFMIAINISFSQTDSGKSIISGKVFSDKNIHLHNSKIIIKNSKSGLLYEPNSDSNGDFKVEISE
ncbi:MAG TPA: hypothetical protein VIL99_15655 [Ignavibacteria bacterium]